MVKYPQARESLIGDLQSLSDPAFQWREWANSPPRQGSPEPGALIYDFDEFINGWHDRGLIADAPEKEIGVVLKNSAEVAAVAAVTNALNRVRDAFLQYRQCDAHLRGTAEPVWPEDKDVSVAMYLSCARWPQVVEAARAAYTVFRESDAADALGNTII